MTEQAQVSEIQPDALLTRQRAASALTERGYPTSPATLATLATRGGGPVFSKFGSHRVLYRWGDLLVWANARLVGPVASTSALSTLGSRNNTHQLAEAS
jgi:hypothetical protein